MMMERDSAWGEAGQPHLPPGSLSSPATNNGTTSTTATQYTTIAKSSTH